MRFGSYIRILYIYLHIKFEKISQVVWEKILTDHDIMVVFWKRAALDQIINVLQLLQIHEICFVGKQVIKDDVY